MTLSFQYEDIEKPNISYEEILRKVVKACLEYEGCPIKVEVNFLFTNDSIIRDINKEFRNIDATTDVLSFPMIDFTTLGDLGYEGIIDDGFHADTGELLLGDIVISMPRAQSQAIEYGHSLEREIAFLTAHSMFHLMGYDHITEEEADIMECKQKAVLHLLGINR